jgi:hypothetical protein
MTVYCDEYLIYIIIIGEVRTVSADQVLTTVLQSILDTTLSPESWEIPEPELRLWTRNCTILVPVLRLGWILGVLLAGDVFFRQIHQVPLLYSANTGSSVLLL